MKTWIQDLFPVPFISRRFKMGKPRQNTEKAAAPVQDMFMHRVWSQRIHIELSRKAKTLDKKSICWKQIDIKHWGIDISIKHINVESWHWQKIISHLLAALMAALFATQPLLSSTHVAAAATNPELVRLTHPPPKNTATCSQASSWPRLTLQRRRFSSHHNGSNAVTAVSDDTRCLRCHFLGGCLLWDSTQDH